MRIQSLHLTAVGPFTDRNLEFSGNSSLHVIYGPNESGKSSTLRALKNLMFGFPHKSGPETFLHRGRDLRVGGTFVLPDGLQRTFVRSKRKQGSLTDGCGNPVDEGEFGSLFKNVDREVFARLYGLSHQELVSGGKALLTAGGKVGASLFAASLGPEFSTLAESLKKEAESLWSSRPSKRPLNECIKEWENCQQQAEQLSLSTDAYEGVMRDCEQARRLQRELKAELLKKQVEFNDLQCLQSSLPAALRRRELLNELSEMTAVPDLQVDFPERKSRILTELVKARQHVDSAKSRRANLAAALQELPERSSIIELSQRVETLFRQIAKVTEHGLDRPKLESEISINEARANQLFQQLGLEPQHALPDAAWRRSVRTHAQERVALDTHQQELERRGLLLEEELQAHKELPQGASEAELDAIEQALSVAQRERGIDDRIKLFSEEIRKIESQLQLSLERLSGWNGDLESLRGARFPSPSQVEEMGSALSKLEQKLEHIRKDVAEKQSELALLQSRVEDISGQEDHLSLEDLQSQRVLRDDLWTDIYNTWLDGETAELQTKLVEEYIRSVRDADGVADKMRLAGDRVAHYEQLLRERQKVSEQLKKLEAESQGLTEQSSRANEQWLQLWPQGGVLMDTPQRMLLWLSERDEIIKTASRISHGQSELESAQTRLSEELDALARATESLALRPFSLTRGLGAAIEVVNEALESLRQNVQEQRSQKERIERLKSDASKLKAQSHAANESRIEWDAEWLKLLQFAHLPQSHDPASLEDILSYLNELERTLEQKLDFEQRLGKLDDDLGAFAKEVDKLRPHLTTSSQEEDQTTLVERAQRELAEAQRVEQERTRLKVEAKELDLELETKERELKFHSELLSHLLTEAAVDEPDQLGPIALLAAQKREKTVELSSLESGLRNQNPGCSLQEFCERVESQDLQITKTELNSLAEVIEALTQKLEAEIHRSGKLETEAAALDGSSKALVLRQEAESQKAQGRDLLDRYFRLTLAEKLLSQQIEQYRRDNEGPILDKASHYFQMLTAGSYSSLKTGFSPGAAEISILGVSQTGREVPIEGMSEGTCDQLFLALRLASIGRQSVSSQSLPIVADDILVQFDDQRAASTLQALADFSAVTQVVLFTHLERDFHLAKSLKDERVEALRLDTLKL